MISAKSLTRSIVRRGGLSLPSGATFRTIGGIDIIGLSVADYLSIRSELRSIFFLDADNKYDDATIITNIEASVYLNCGWELGGNATRGYFLYIEGTTETVLRRAYQWAGEIFPDTATFGPTWAEPGHWSDNSIWSE